MATIADLVLRTEEILYGTGLWERPDEDVTTGALANTSATSLTVSGANMWKRGDYLEFVPVDGSVDEVCYVAANSSGTLTIRRGQRNSTAAAQGSGDVIRRNPAFTRVAIGQKIEHVVNNQLWPHVWSWHSDTLTFAAGDQLYDLDPYVEDVVRVYQANINSDGTFAPIDNGRWDVVRQVNTAVSANSNLLRLDWVWDENSTVYYEGKRRPNYADLANIDDRLADLVPYGAAAHLLYDRAPQVDMSSKRSGRSGGGANASYGQLFDARFNEMVDQYRRQLLGEVPEEPKFRHRYARRW